MKALLEIVKLSNDVVTESPTTPGCDYIPGSCDDDD